MSVTELILLLLLGAVVFMSLHPRGRRVYRHHYTRARRYAGDRYNSYRRRRYGRY